MMLSKSFRVARYLAPLAMVIAMAGCDDNGTGPGGGLSFSDRTKLSGVILEPAIMTELFGDENSAAATLMVPFLVTGLPSLGTIEVSASGAPTLIAPNGVRHSLSAPVRKLNGTPNGTYRAFGAQLVVTLKSSQQLPAENVVWTGIIGVNNLDNPTDVIAVGKVQLNTTVAPNSIATTSFGGESDAQGSYFLLNDEQTTIWNATSGQMAISEASFTGSPTTCPGTLVPQITICNYIAGTMDGSFNFTGTRTSGTGGSATVTVPSTTVSVPAVRFRFSYDATVGQQLQ